MRLGSVIAFSAPIIGMDDEVASRKELIRLATEMLLWLPTTMSSHVLRMHVLIWNCLLTEQVLTPMASWHAHGMAFDSMD